MFEISVRHLPVKHSSGVVVGILSDRDIQRAMVVRKQVSRSLTIKSLFFKEHIHRIEFISLSGLLLGLGFMMSITGPIHRNPISLYV